MNESEVRAQSAQLWKHLFRVAVLETNRELVPRRVLEARKAAAERAMYLIRESSDGEELHDLVYASRVLDTERSFLPPVSPIRNRRLHLHGSSWTKIFRVGT
jgi:hypothetical protein